MADCIFCKIVSGEIPSVKIWEDSDFIAILDVMPNAKGMTLVIPKKHFDSYVFDMPRVEYKNFMLATKKVAKYVERGLRVERVALVMEGMGVDHAHNKLYPLHGLSKTFTDKWNLNEIYFYKYTGYLSTQPGPKKDLTELQKVADEIKKNNQ